MNFIPTDPRVLFERWGKNVQQLPAKSEALKEKILQAIPPATDSKVHLRRPSRFTWVLFSGAALATLILVINLSDASRQKTSGPAAWPTAPQATNESKSEQSRGHLQSAGGGRDKDAAASSEALGIEYGQYTGLGQQDIRTTKLGRIAVGVSSVLNRFSDTSLPTTEPPITDTREFLKTDYAASLYTRKVGKLARQVQTIVRGHGGRIDNASVEADSAYVTFVIPKNSFALFKDELQSVVPERFLVESQQEENLLLEKRQIETASSDTDKKIALVEKNRQARIGLHDNIISVTNRRLAAIASRMTVLDGELKQDPPLDEAARAKVMAELNRLSNERYNLVQRLAAENKGFKAELSNFDQELSTLKSTLSTLKKQDNALLDTVATVNGSISVEWISWYEIITLYVPAGWLWVIALGGIVALYVIRRRRIRFELP